MKKTTITPNCQSLFNSNGFRRTFSKKCYTVGVWRDWDGNRLLKTVDGKVVAELAVPRNWTDKDRADGRKWTVATVYPTAGFHLSPTVTVVFADTVKGKTITKNL